ncbi:MAG: selenium metabolism-associated LysR family transcriptional regulator [Defluviitaleaceae bacterium]|nr:selenium metabolism-associated LysR family transcriptional regulator [Defluviitaleaceae bacterium]
MDFKQLEAYINVVECASFSKAAEAIFMSQPSVSAYITGLEKELGTTLLNRSTKEVSPTLAGKMFYENAKGLIALKYKTIEGIKSLAGNLSGEITIAASSVPAQYILPEILGGFTQKYPSISFVVKQSDTLDVSHRIASQQADIGFAGDIIENSKCQFTRFMDEKMVMIAPKGFDADKEHSLETLLYENPFVSREKGSGTRKQYEAFFTKQGIDLSKTRFSICFDNTQSIINAVASGVGVSIVSEYAARSFIENGMVVVLKLKKALPERAFYYVLRKNYVYSHLIDLFVEYIKGI